MISCWNRIGERTADAHIEILISINQRGFHLILTATILFLWVTKCHDKVQILYLDNNISKLKSDDSYVFRKPQIILNIFFLAISNGLDWKYRLINLLSVWLNLHRMHPTLLYLKACWSLATRLISAKFRVFCGHKIWIGGFIEVIRGLPPGEWPGAFLQPLGGRHGSRIRQ